MTNIDVKDINEFHKAIAKVKETFPYCWYRGLTDLTYPLSPSIYRSPYKTQLESTFLGRFKSQAPPFLTHMPQNDWEWLFLMQHYGVPTRLMDWTELPMVALIFALKNITSAAEDTKDLVVYCLNPKELNKKVSGITFNENDPIPFIGKEQEHLYGVGQTKKNNLPIAIIGPLNNHRIVAQKGAFTLFPFELHESIEQHAEAKEFLIKITLKTGQLSKFKNDLTNFGITYNSLFPGLDSIANDIIIPYKM
jgi:hypothetical protein